MDYDSAKRIACYIECRSEFEAFDRDKNIVLERAVRACFSSLRKREDITRIKIYMYAHEPKLSIEDNVFYYNKHKGIKRYYPVTDLSITMMRKILDLAKSIVDFKSSISIEHIIDENGNDRFQYCTDLLFPGDTNIIQKLFVCTVVRWFYEQQNRYIALKAYELYNTEKYHRFGFFNLYCFVKEQCYDNVNGSGHDLLDGKSLARRIFFVPEKLKSLYEMSSSLRDGKSITLLWRGCGYSRIPVKTLQCKLQKFTAKAVNKNLIFKRGLKAILISLFQK